MINLFSLFNALIVMRRIKLKLLVNLDFVLPAVNVILLFELKKLPLLLLMLNIEVSFLLFLKNLECFSSMIETF